MRQALAAFERLKRLIIQPVSSYTLTWLLGTQSADRTIQLPALSSATSTLALLEQPQAFNAVQSYGQPLRAADDSSAGPSYSWTSAPTTGWYLSGGANPVLACAGIDRVLVSIGGSVVISRNSAGMGITALATGLDCHGADGASFSIGLSSYGSISNFTARNAGAGSTVALPLAMTAGQVAAIFGARGYYGTFGVDGAYSTSELARMRVMSDESGALTATARGFKLSFQATTAGTTTLNSVMDVLGDRVSVLQTLEASSVSAASLISAGGIGIAKRAYLGTIATTFSGHVLAGVQDGTADTVGAVGETLVSTVTAAAAGATGVAANATSVSVTRGKWMGRASVTISGGATGLTNGSTVKVSVVTTSATNGTNGSTMVQQTVHSLAANGLHSLSINLPDINISAAATYYLVVECTYAAGSPTIAGSLIFTRSR